MTVALALISATAENMYRPLWSWIVCVVVTVVVSLLTNLEGRSAAGGGILLLRRFRARRDQSRPAVVFIQDRGIYGE
jgi:hypothetical protein